ERPAAAATRTATVGPAETPGHSIGADARLIRTALGPAYHGTFGRGQEARRLVCAGDRRLELAGRRLRGQRRPDHDADPAERPRERDPVPGAPEDDAARHRAPHRDEDAAGTTRCEEDAGLDRAVRAARTVDREGGVAPPTERAHDA